MNKKEQIAQLRLEGKTYRDIAKVVGVSYQYVAQVCAGTNINTDYFKAYTESNCIYPKLREILNNKRLSRIKILESNDLSTSGENINRLTAVLKGVNKMTKVQIDRLIKATGCKYEELF